MNPIRIRLPHRWEPRTYQIPPWTYFESDNRRKRGVLVWHRRAGKDLFGVNLIAKEAMKRVGTYWHLFPEFKQAKAAIWNGTTSEGVKYLDHIPPEIISKKYENEARIKLTNGSSYYLVGSDNYNSLMGTNPIGIVLSEYSLQKAAAWQYLSPILAENGGWALFIHTYRGLNHGWLIAQMAKRDPTWFFDEQIAGSSAAATKRPDGSPVVADEEIEQLRREGIPESVIQSEFYNNPKAPVEGAYYTKEIAAVEKEGRVRSVPYDARYAVYTSWDIGHDMTVIVFFQIISGYIHFINCIFKSELGLPFYVQKVKEMPYTYDKHFAPWDMDTREFASGKSRMTLAANLGINFTVTPQKPGNAGIKDGIEQVRAMLSRSVFDEKNCEVLLNALRAFRAEEDTEKSQMPASIAAGVKVFKDTPLHDWASHFDAAMRGAAWNLSKAGGRKNLPSRAKDEYNYT